MRNHFFGPSGMTSTSANHVANMAKEYVRTQMAKLENVSFVDTSVSAAGHTYVTGSAVTKEQFNEIKNILNQVDLAHRLIAWLREALKEKANAEPLSLNAWAAVNNQEIPVEPEHEKVITEEEIIAQWDIEKYNSYFANQTRASVFGEAVHPNGPISSARNFAEHARNVNYEVMGTGRDLTVHKHVPAFTANEIDDLYFDLQNEQREAQARFNKLRYEIDSTIESDKIAKDEKYKREFADWAERKSLIRAAYSAYATQEKKRLSELKIIVPESLREILNIVQGLGK